MNRVNKGSLVLLLVLVVALLGLMIFVPPTSGTATVFVWFGLVGAVVYFGLRLLSGFFALDWPKVRVMLYSVAALSLIGLSTLNQLTVLDVVAVLILTGLAQLTYQLRAKSK